MLYLSVVWTVIGLAAIVRSYILLMGENTPDARRKTATTTRVVGFTLIVVGVLLLLISFLVLLGISFIARRGIVR